MSREPHWDARWDAGGDALSPALDDEGEPRPPAFAVVGHPNKGKSSLVATLARDERVRVAPEPGTTTRAIHYPLRVDGQILYVLVDTPGFQRARGALAWLREEAARQGATAADRPEIVRRFCVLADVRARFAEEVELLGPIVGGAAILYVVDGAVPYGREYEAEMEILRWTGRPSMAVINPIGADTHVETWRAALAQYFRVVRVMDPLRADFETRLDLLRAFAQLDEARRPLLERAVQILEVEQRRRRQRAAAAMARTLVDASSLVVERRVAPDAELAAARSELAERYRSELRRIERRGWRAVEGIYDFGDLRVEESETGERDTQAALLAEDLFARETWLVFGLRRRDLLALGATAGAASGGALDVAAGGTSLLAGAAVGGLAGGVLGWLGAGRLARLRLLRQPLGGTLLRMGPARAGNLAFVILGRARLHHALVASRTHARRDPRLRLAEHEEEGGRLGMERATTRRIAAALRSPESAQPALEREIEPLLAADLEALRKG